MEEFMFLGLRMNAGVTREDFAKCFSCSIESVYGEAIKHLRQEALLEVAEGRMLFDRQGNGSEQLCPGTFPPVRSFAPKGTVHVAKGASLRHKKFTKINKKNCEKC